MRKLTLAIIDDRGQLAEDAGGWAVPITDVTRESASQDREQLAATLDHGRNHLGHAKPMAPQGWRFAVAVMHDRPGEVSANWERGFGHSRHRVRHSLQFE
jgi:hypothetical protein